MFSLQYTETEGKRPAAQPVAVSQSHRQDTLQQPQLSATVTKTNMQLPLYSFSYTNLKSVWWCLKLTSSFAAKLPNFV